MSDWKAPKFGSPVWLGIIATDVSRAEKFYTTVFNWSFKPPSTKPSATSFSESPVETRQFDFRPDVHLTGGIHSIMKDSTGAAGPGPGGVCAYWLVEDLKKIAEVIEEAGGKMRGESEEPIKEGEFGLYRFFEDTEGNVGAVYQIVGM